MSESQRTVSIRPTLPACIRSDPAPKTHASSRRAAPKIEPISGISPGGSVNNRLYTRSIAALQTRAPFRSSSVSWRPQPPCNRGTESLTAPRIPGVDRVDLSLQSATSNQGVIDRASDDARPCSLLDRGWYSSPVSVISARRSRMFSRISTCSPLRRCRPGTWSSSRKPRADCGRHSNPAFGRHRQDF